MVIPAISGVPVPGAKAGSNTSISIDKYKGLLPTLFLILSAILSVYMFRSRLKIKNLIFFKP